MTRPGSDSSAAADPLAHWPGRTTLTDTAGRTVLVYTPAEDARDGRPWADGVWRPGDVPVEAAAEQGLDQLSGHAVSTSDPDLVAAWTATGATTLRHAHVMSHDLGTIEPFTATGVSTYPLSPRQLARHADGVGRIMFEAYPPDHPDHRFQTPEAAIAGITAIGRGEVLGPMLGVSQVALYAAGIVGAAVIVDRAGQAPDGGPWVLDIFRDPASPAKGIGRALLTAVLHAAREAGLPSMTLVVSHPNTHAFALYTSLGFVDHEQSWTLALPT